MFLWARNGKRHETGLGSLRAVSLARARALAAQARADVAEGYDPRVARKLRMADAITFGEVVERLPAHLAPLTAPPKRRRP